MKNNQTIYLALVILASGFITSCSSVKHNQAASTSFNHSKEQDVSQTYVPESDRPAKAQGSTAGTEWFAAPDVTELEASASETPAVLPTQKRYTQTPASKPRVKEVVKAVKEAAKARETQIQTPSSKLSLKERKVLRYKMQSKLEASDDQVLEIVLAILIPPLGVYIHEDEINTKFWISLILTLLFYFPGAIYSLLVVLDVI